MHFLNVFFAILALLGTMVSGNPLPSNELSAIPARTPSEDNTDLPGPAGHEIHVCCNGGCRGNQCSFQTSCSWPGGDCPSGFNTCCTFWIWY